MNLTWEGDNNVLIQQTARWLLTSYQKDRFDKFSSLQPLQDEMKEAFDPRDLKSALKWKVQWLLQESVAAIAKDGIVAWNDLQPLYLRKLGLSLGEFFTATRLEAEIASIEGEGNKSVITRMYEIFCTHRILEDIGEYYKGAFITS